MKDVSGSIIIDMPTLEEQQRRYIKLILKKINGKISGPDGAINILGMK